MTPPKDDSMLRGEGIVCLSSIDWDFLWQGHQEVMLRLSAAGNLVLFVENTGVRAPSFGDIPRLIARLQNWWGGVDGFREQAPNLIVLSPLLLPFPYSRVARRVNAWLLGRAIANWLAAIRHGSPIVWTFLPTPLVNDLLDALAPSLVVYYCIDNFAASSPGANAIGASEDELFRRADLVFVTSRELQNKARRHRSEAHFFPFGVDYEGFARHRARGGPEPRDVADIPRPRFGYIGGIHQWIDFELLQKAAAARPDYHLVLVGPEQTDVTPLHGLPNVHLIGSRPHDALPAYLGAFDTALIPYRLTEYTASVYPTKLNEYLAMGLPVVSTALPEVSAFNEVHDGIVRVATDAEGFLAFMDESLRAAPSDRHRRLEAARLNGWAERVGAMSRILRVALDNKRSNPAAIRGLMGRLAHRHRRVAAAVGLTCVIIGAVLRGTPLAWRLCEPLMLSQNPSAADAVVVLGGGAGESGQIGQGHEERANRAIQLYLQGYAAKIVFCSSNFQRTNELEVMRAIALARGVREADILSEPQGGGTRTMVLNAGGLLRAKGWKKILLVSSPYHMKRAVLVWRRASPDVEVVPTPAQRSMFYSYDAARGSRIGRPPPTWAQLRGLLQESLTLALYSYRRWI